MRFSTRPLKVQVRWLGSGKNCLGLIKIYYGLSRVLQKITQIGSGKTPSGRVLTRPIPTSSPLALLLLRPIGLLPNVHKICNSLILLGNCHCHSCSSMCVLLESDMKKNCTRAKNTRWVDLIPSYKIWSVFEQYDGPEGYRHWHSSRELEKIIR